MTKGKILISILLTITLLSCGTTEPTNFITFRCVESSPLGSQSFLVDVYHSQIDSTIYLISNFHNLTTEDIGDITIKKYGTKITTSPTNQSIPSTPYQIKGGEGTINENFTEMILNYNFFDGQKEFAVHAVFSR